jgi:hypothetical protein
MVLAEVRSGGMLDEVHFERMAATNLPSLARILRGFVTRK